MVSGLRLLCLALTLPCPSQDNYPPEHNMCMMGSEFQAAVVVSASSGYELINEGTADKPKWGWIATTPGAKLQFELSTQLESVSHLDPAAAPPPVRMSACKSACMWGRQRVPMRCSDAGRPGTLTTWCAHVAGGERAQAPALGFRVARPPGQLRAHGCCE